MKTPLFFFSLLFPAFLFSQFNKVIGIDSIPLTQINPSPPFNYAFGYSVEPLGDLNGDGFQDIAVGSRNGGGTGLVYILFLDANRNVKDTTVIGNQRGGFTGNIPAGGLFSVSMVNLGDLDGDGTLELAIGNSLHDNTSTDEGVVWILSLDPSGFVQNTTLIGDGANGFPYTLDNNERFGASLSKLPDIDGDGIPELIVGAPRRAVNNQNTGRVYLIKFTSNLTLKSVDILDKNTPGLINGISSTSRFGLAVSYTNDLDQNGVPEIVVADPSKQTSNGKRGFLWILFLDNNLDISNISEITQNTPGFYNHLDTSSYILNGAYISNVGDMNLDGIDDLAMAHTSGVIKSDSTNKVRFLMLTNQGQLKESRILKSGPGIDFTRDVRSDNFGVGALALAPDLDGDSKKDLILGVPNQNSIYMMSLDGPSTVGLAPAQRGSIALDVYPNPATSTLNISFPEKYTGKTFELRLQDAMGRTVMEKSVKAGGNGEYRLDVVVDPGTYTLQISHGEEFFNQTILLTRD